MISAVIAFGLLSFALLALVKMMHDEIQELNKALLRAERPEIAAIAAPKQPAADDGEPLPPVTPIFR
jgi:hypothetical protein